MPYSYCWCPWFGFAHWPRHRFWMDVVKAVMLSNCRCTGLSLYFELVIDLDVLWLQNWDSILIDNTENRLVCKMYTKSELESMTFKELKRLAREKSISQCWTSKVIFNSTPSHSISLRYLLILPFYWCLGIARDLFTSGSHSQHYSFVFVHTRHLPISPSFIWSPK